MTRDEAAGLTLGALTALAAARWWMPRVAAWLARPTSADRYARTIGLHLSREQRAQEAWRLSAGAPVRRMRRPR